MSKSALGMSDEEFEKLDPSEYPADEERTEELDETSDNSGDDHQTDSSEGSETAADGAADPSTEDESEDETPDADEEEPSESAEESTGEVAEKPATETAESEQKKPDETDTTVDYEAEYKKLLAPFKANGKEMSVANVGEALQLMQMGANYNKKMAALKPALKTLKMLENHELLDEGKLSYLIDLHKGDKGAIQKLLKDSGIDPLDMDSDTESDYKPKTYTVDEREMLLDEVLERIQDTPTYNQTINVVSNKWDRASKQMIADQPSILETINGHMASGIYSRVNAEVEKERAFGRLIGLSDLEAYRVTGDAMNARGAFNDLIQPSQTTAPAAKQSAPVALKKAPDPQLNAKKRAASSTKAKTAAPAQNLNPLAMSDEAFEAQFNEKFL